MLRQDPSSKNSLKVKAWENVFSTQTQAKPKKLSEMYQKVVLYDFSNETFPFLQNWRELKSPSTTPIAGFF